MSLCVCMYRVIQTVASSEPDSALIGFRFRCVCVCACLCYLIEFRSLRFRASDFNLERFGFTAVRTGPLAAALFSEFPGFLIQAPGTQTLLADFHDPSGTRPDLSRTLQRNLKT